MPETDTYGDTLLCRDLAAYTLRLGDDALVLAQRLCEWITHAPTVEEDLALSNIALDLLGQARVLYAQSGRHDGTGRDEDDLAYGREPSEFRNVLLVELPKGDFADLIARQLVWTHHCLLLHTALRGAADPELAALAERAVEETRYHRSHADRWVACLAHGTPQSKRRLQAALDRVWPYTDELFEADALVRRLAEHGAVASPTTLRESWEREMTTVLAQAGLRMPTVTGHQCGGRRGAHTATFGDLVAELREVRCAHPGGTW
ncbi:1,2-phenylacetyl-CoA epoxidase subunit PaaC [Kitasatospora kifunensis]|uniref:Ring-1,2-phenylacetyl-CoA epoxidase subunit PaaC n=1 Tax=Kitasatospora kifunensis TaxID=58351 RepID=A0A7W7RBB6_KITKI|nr:1,2-phenylacetyl-CoA epoxidase subunit PaaC [Kitasatospora kifunensis]MBB4928226.1 ring-1,2-phenylacetyl-CoA epoxidase subunit PaaC [Kitasatospora kifunensis]